METPPAGTSSPTPLAHRARVAAAILIVLIMGALAVKLFPLYLENFRFQQYVEEMARDAENRTRPDDGLRAAVLQEAAVLGLPVRADNVQIKRSGDALRIEVRYIIRVDFPLYTVDLHFYPGAGSQ